VNGGTGGNGGSAGGYTGDAQGGFGGGSGGCACSTGEGDGGGYYGGVVLVISMTAAFYPEKVDHRTLPQVSPMLEPMLGKNT
jgi:hypothetical protein